jgi:hypothetical protein
MWEPRRLTTLWTSTTCYRNSFTFYLYPLRSSRTVSLVKIELVSYVSETVFVSIIRVNVMSDTAAHCIYFRERERGMMYSRRVGECEKSWRKWDILLGGGRKSTICGNVPRASPSHPFDKIRVKVKPSEQLEAVASDTGLGIFSF